MKKLTALILLLCSTPTWAGSFGSSGRGTTTAPFLTLGVGARAVAMGEAASAVVDDASALYWNPAGLSRIEKRAATFMHAPYIDSSRYDYGAYAQNFSFGAVGLGMQYFNAGAVTETDINGVDVGQITPHDMAVSLGYAYTMKSSFLSGFAVGLSGKFIQSKLETSAQTGAADIGLLSPTWMNDKLRLAFTVQNLGGHMKFEEESEDLPLVMKGGASLQITKRWLSAVDVGFPKNDNPFVAVGTEYGFSVGDSWMMAGRLGYNSRTTGSVDGFSGVSFGAGFTFQKMTLDYGFLPFGNIGQAHLISLSSKF